MPNTIQLLVLLTAPANADSIHAYIPGTTNPIVGQLKTVAGANLPNPFIVAAAGGQAGWAVVLPDGVPADLYWEEGDSTIAKNQGGAIYTHAGFPDLQLAASGVTWGHVSNSAPLQLPELTTVERDLIVANEGMVIRNTTTSQIEEYTAGAWAAVGGGGETLELVEVINISSPVAEIQFPSSGVLDIDNYDYIFTGSVETSLSSTAHQLFFAAKEASLAAVVDADYISNGHRNLGSIWQVFNIAGSILAYSTTETAGNFIEFEIEFKKDSQNRLNFNQRSSAYTTSLANGSVLNGYSVATYPAFTRMLMGAENKLGTETFESGFIRMYRRAKT